MLKAVTLLAQDTVSKQTAQQIDTIKIHTSLITVPVIVKDSQDRFVTGLSKDDFVVRENGDRQEIINFSFTEDPINVALILDTSPSTKEWLSTMRKYALDFIKQLRPQDKVLIVTFDERVHFLGEFTNDRRLLTAQVNTMKSGIATAFYDAIYLTINEQFSKIKGPKAIAAFTDGKDSWSQKAKANSTLELVLNAGIPFYIIQYWTDTSSAQFLSSLATSSGGLHIPVESIKNTNSAFATIANELSHQYTLWYYSDNEQQDGNYKKISVSVNRTSVTTRTRQGYRVVKD